MKEDKRKTEYRTQQCRNCRRVKFIVRDGLCWSCAKESAGKTGQEQANALAEIKRRIEAGEVRKGGPKPFGANPPCRPRQAVPGNGCRRSTSAAYPRESKTMVLEEERIVPIRLKLTLDIDVRMTCTAG